MKKLGVLFLTITAIIISSCGLTDENTPEACSFAVSQALDKGNYDYVIQKLEADPTCGGAFTQEESKINLAAAYIGKAGFDITSLVNDMIKSGNEKGDAFAVFTQAIAKRASGNTVKYLEKAKKLYEDIYGQIDCGDKNAIQNLPNIVKDACFYAGLADTAKATTSLALLIGGDETDPDTIAQLVEDWANANNTTAQCSDTDVNANSIPDSADATSCALQYAVSLSDNDNTNDAIPYDCGNGISITSRDNSITFTNLTTSFINLNIQIQPDATCSTQYQSQTFKRLIYDMGGSIYTTALTNGYCDTNFNTCDKTQNGCYPCPVITEDENNNQLPTSTADVIIDTINNGADTISAVVSQQDNADLNQTITDFKKDLCSSHPSACECIDANGNQVDCTDSTAVDNATDVKIKSPSQDPNVQQLISNYLQNK